MFWRRYAEVAVNEMTTKTIVEEGDRAMATLPQDILATTAEANRKNPSKEVMALVSEIISALAASKRLIPAMQSFGNPSEFVQAIAAEVRRLRSIGAR
jgi:hypothetical protein